MCSLLARRVDGRICEVTARKTFLHTLRSDFQGALAQIIKESLASTIHFMVSPAAGIQAKVEWISYGSAGAPSLPIAMTDVL